MSATIIIEGGGDDRDLHIRCRDGFRNLLIKCGFSGRMPRLVAGGGRQQTIDKFATKVKYGKPGDYIAMIIDSEDPVEDINRPWIHLCERDKCTKPEETDDNQVLLMVTCMETWIMVDRVAMCNHYGSKLQESALLAIDKIEHRGRQVVQEALFHATRNCTNSYKKGKRSFRILSELNPQELERHLPSFRRLKKILNEKLI